MTANKSPIDASIQFYDKAGRCIEKPYTSIRELADKMRALDGDANLRGLLYDAAELLEHYATRQAELEQQVIDLKNGLNVSKAVTAGLIEGMQDDLR